MSYPTTWRPPRFFSNPYVRWGVIVCVVGYFLLSYLTLDVDWQRTLKGIPRAIDIFQRMFPPNFSRWEILVRCGDPDAMDSIVPMAFGNLALDLILKGIHGRLVVLRNGRYDNAPLDVVTSSKKLVDVKKHYNIDRLRPHYKSFEFQR